MEPINLTKRYRLIWNKDTLKIQNDHERDYANTVTTMGNPSNDTYESNDFTDIENKIEELNLIVPSEEDELDELE